MKRAKSVIAALCAAIMIVSSACAESAHDSGIGESGASSASEETDTSDKDKKNKKKDIKDQIREDKNTEIIFGRESGFYSEPFELELSAKHSSAKIYYTTDGSVPDENSTLYTGAIKLEDRSDEENSLSARTDIVIGEAVPPENKIHKANIIRAAAYNENGLMGKVESRTYFIGLNREALYGSAPVISIITPPDGLFDYEKGIYVLGKAHEDFLNADPANKMVPPWHQEANYTQRGREWEREASFELFPSDGEDFSQTLGLRIMGKASRNECQKSFRLTARDDYGRKSVKYELIPDNERSDGSGAVEKYKSFVLRNGGNDSSGTKFRDPLLQGLAAERAFDTLQTQPAVVYLDGEYWGLYTITEDYSDNYIENNYGIDNKNVIIIKRGDIEEGDITDSELFTEMYDYIMNNDMSDGANYARASEMLDMQGFADLCAFNIYINNEDGIFQNNNYRFWRVRTPDDSCAQADGKWRVLLYDTEYSTGVYDGGQSSEFNTLDGAVNNTLKADKELAEPPSELFRKLLDNAEFKDMFILSLCDMRNICFNKQHAAAKMQEFADKYRPLSAESAKRYGHDPGEFEWSVGGLGYFLDSRFDRFMKMITDTFGDMKKNEIALMKTDGGRILVNGTTADPNFDLKTQYFTGQKLKLTAVPDEGKRFVEWRYIGNCEIPDDKSAEIEVTVTGELSVTAVFE